jgi:DNA mismatch repair protein MutS
MRRFCQTRQHILSPELNQILGGYGLPSLFQFKFMSALLDQYKAIKAKYPDTILLFRVGDFSETFGEDANVVSQCLGIVLTQSSNDELNEVAGFPLHSLDGHLRTLVKAGYRVAICDQLEDPRTAKGIVKGELQTALNPRPNRWEIKKSPPLRAVALLQ